MGFYSGINSTRRYCGQDINVNKAHLLPISLLATRLRLTQVIAVVLQVCVVNAYDRMWKFMEEGKTDVFYNLKVGVRS